MAGPRGARRFGAAAMALVALAACAPPKTPGAARNAVTAEGGAVSVVAGGREIAVSPPPGFCVDEDSLLQRPDAVFVLMEDCAQLGRGDRSAGVPGLVTLSLGNVALFPPQPVPRPGGLATGREGGAAARAAPAPAALDRSASFAALERFLRTEEGRATAGMGGEADQIRVVETRRTEDTLYVLVEDTGDQVIPVLGPRFWRGFTELNGRAAIASLGVFAVDPMEDSAMLGHLARVVTTLKRANGDPVSPDEAALASSAAGSAGIGGATVAAQIEAGPAAPARPED